MAVRIKNKQELERYHKSFYEPMTSKSNDEKSDEQAPSASQETNHRSVSGR
jgi:hypothetical protein